MELQGPGKVNSMQKSLSALFHAGFLLGFHCDPEDGGDVAFCYVNANWRLPCLALRQQNGSYM
jgi:hypothetical protein